MSITRKNAEQFLGTVGFDFKSDHFDLDSSFILGIDPGIANLGWVVALPEVQGGKVVPIVIECGYISTKPTMHKFERCQYIANELYGIHTIHPFEAFVMEQYQSAGPKSIPHSNYMRGMLDGFIYSEIGDIWPHTEVHNAHVKKWITGKGNANKNEVIMALSRHLDRENPAFLHKLQSEHKASTHEHIIEAYAMIQICYAVLREICESDEDELDLTKKQQEVVASIINSRDKYVFGPGESPLK
jgi:Holliday junction resolvasome RuvABC endonuclease subunit